VNGRAKRDVVRITDAPSSLSEDIEGRRRRYLLSMGIRIVCFVSAYFAHGWLRWVVVAGAVFIPYFAVVVANAGRTVRAGAPLPPVTPALRQLTGAATAPHATGRSADSGRPAAPDDLADADGPVGADRLVDAEAQWASQTAGSLVHDRTSAGS